MEFLQNLIADYGWNLLGWTREHVTLTFLAMLIACVLAIPTGIFLAHTRFRLLANAVLGVVNVIQPIPSLALVGLVAILFKALGWSTIGLVPGLVVLVAYALLPILRNTYTGIRQVDPSVIDVAVGMGMTPAQVLIQVELPLALPFIMAGIRIATVWTVGVATLVALVGAGGLGEPIFQGLGNFKLELMLAGVVPAVALALILDWSLGATERWLTPAGLSDVNRTA
jgi:osmoprotectant transport system permease protein